MGGNACQNGGHFLGLEAVGAGLALISDMPPAIDDVEPVRPACVRRFGGVAEVVEKGGQLYVEVTHAGLGHFAASLRGMGVRKDDLVTDVRSGLPGVAGVRLFEVNDKERDAVFVLVIQAVKSRDLPAKWRSGVTAENQDYGLLAAQGRELHSFLAINRLEAEFRRGVSDSQASGAGK
jgi:hypothetical protein